MPDPAEAGRRDAAALEAAWRAEADRHGEAWLTLMHRTGPELWPAIPVGERLAVLRDPFGGPAPRCGAYAEDLARPGAAPGWCVAHAPSASLLTIVFADVGGALWLARALAGDERLDTGEYGRPPPDLVADVEALYAEAVERGWGWRRVPGAGA